MSLQVLHISIVIMSIGHTEALKSLQLVIYAEYSLIGYSSFCCHPLLLLVAPLNPVWDPLNFS